MPTNQTYQNGDDAGEIVVIGKRGVGVSMGDSTLDPLTSPLGPGYWHYTQQLALANAIVENADLHGSQWAVNKSNVNTE